MDRPPSCKFYQNGFCLREDDCPYSHPTQRCTSFSRGFCPYGLSCHFWHDRSAVQENLTDTIQSPQLCSFFLNGQCMYGNRCAFSHQLENLPVSNQITLSEYKLYKQITEPRVVAPPPKSGSSLQQTVQSEANSPLNPSCPPVARPNARLEQAYLSALQPGDLEKMRDLEIDRLSKQFPPSRLKPISGNNDSVRAFSLLFSSTDPDWSHEIKQILLQITLPTDYPKSSPVLTVPRTSNLPDVVTDKLNHDISKWVKERQNSNTSANKVSLYLRSFFFWLDKSLNNLMTQGYGAVASNVEQEPAALSIPESFDSTLMSSFSSVQSLPKAQPFSESIQPSALSNRRPQSPSSEPEQEEASKESGAEEPEAGEEDVSSAVIHQQDFSLEGVEMRGQAGTCLFTRLPVCCTCTRCKYIFNWVFTLPPATKTTEGTTKQTLSSVPPHTTTCQRCRLPLGLTFVADLIHSFASRVGTFNLANCFVFETNIRSAEAFISCSNCPSDGAKVVTLNPDRVNVKRCLGCHAPCGIFFTGFSVSKSRQAPSEICKQFGSLSIKKLPKEATRQKRIRGPRDCASSFLIQKGTPLPNNGTCRHYRKSFRWLRFRCCGRAFPCDVCHDDEVAGAHETLLATRSICGFCSHEQAVTGASSSSVLCAGCQRALTATSSSHWEGGRGCRDPVKMSRKDNRKHRRL